MAFRVYNAALKGTIDLNDSEIRAALLMTNTMADTHNDGDGHMSVISQWMTGPAGWSTLRANSTAHA